VIGNDIVDLALARKESNWKRPGYLNKIFTTKEQLLFHLLKTEYHGMEFMESERGGL
jgi:phosphopantetheinyl transferase (holo-ACP synthase)